MMKKFTTKILFLLLLQTATLATSTNRHNGLTINSITTRKTLSFQNKNRSIWIFLRGGSSPPINNNDVNTHTPSDVFSKNITAAAPEKNEEEDKSPPELITDIAHPQMITDEHPPSVSASASAPAPSPQKRTLKNASERIPAAIAMALLFSLLIKQFGSKGIIALSVLFQFAMYQEITSILPQNIEFQYLKWWWFGTVITTTSFRAMVVSDLIQCDIRNVDCLSYSMGILGLLASIVIMTTHSDASPELFQTYLSEIAVSVFALLFVVAQPSFWILTVSQFGIEWILYPAFLVILNDTMAYVFGCFMGNTKLLPKLSPKKTVEGFVGAGITTLILSIPLYYKLIPLPYKRQNALRHSLIMGLFVSLVAPFGGFLASAVKRAVGVKDFGTLIPGHGGVVDRLDCHVVTAPFVYLYLRKFLIYTSGGGGD